MYYLYNIINFLLLFFLYFSRSVILILFFDLSNGLIVNSTLGPIIYEYYIPMYYTMDLICQNHLGFMSPVFTAQCVYASSSSIELSENKKKLLNGLGWIGLNKSG